LKPNTIIHLNVPEHLYSLNFKLIQFLSLSVLEMTHKWEKCWCCVHLLHTENKWMDSYKTAHQGIYSQHCQKFIYFHYISHYKYMMTEIYKLSPYTTNITNPIIQYTSNISKYFQVAFDDNLQEGWHICDYNKQI
jgi:hypothetical protein